MPSGPCDSPAVDKFFFERQAHRGGFLRVAGIDEAGRGPLAGPVVAAAVILPEGMDVLGIDDSKQLRPARREALYESLLSCGCDMGIACIEAHQIDAINILQATFRAMLEAVGGLREAPDFLLIDGPYTLPTPIRQRGIIKGDQLSLSIGAASIVAKVHRDRLMNEYHRQFPVYGFNNNKGYGTAEHLSALRRHGPCPIHRMSFRGTQPQRSEGCGDAGLKA